MGSVSGVRDLVAHSGGEPELAPILEFRDDLAFKNEKDVSSIAPVIRDVTGTIFDVPDADIAHRHRAPQRDTGLSGVFRRGSAVPIDDLKG